MRPSNALRALEEVLGERDPELPLTAGTLREAVKKTEKRVSDEECTEEEPLMQPRPELEREIRRNPTMNERFLLGLLDEARGKVERVRAVQRYKEFSEDPADQWVVYCDDLDTALTAASDMTSAARLPPRRSRRRTGWGRTSDDLRDSQGGVQPPWVLRIGRWARLGQDQGRRLVLREGRPELVPGAPPRVGGRVASSAGSEKEFSTGLAFSPSIR